MSTPLIAGAAALVRQYFLSGFYPGGSSAPANQYAPSGAAVKAVLLGGAAGMDGFCPMVAATQLMPSWAQHVHKSALKSLCMLPLLSWLSQLPGAIVTDIRVLNMGRSVPQTWLQCV